MSAKKLMRQGQHRPGRDVVKVREVAALKRENRRLEREAARLRRQVEKVVGSANAFESIDESETVELPNSTTQAAIQEARQSTGAQRCWMAGCDGITRHVDLGRIEMEVCCTCKAHRKLPSDAI